MQCVAVLLHQCFLSLRWIEQQEAIWGSEACALLPVGVIMIWSKTREQASFASVSFSVCVCVSCFCVCVCEIVSLCVCVCVCVCVHMLLNS